MFDKLVAAHKADPENRDATPDIVISSKVFDQLLVSHHHVRPNELVFMSMIHARNNLASTEQEWIKVSRDYSVEDKFRNKTCSTFSMLWYVLHSPCCGTVDDIDLEKP